MTDYIDTRDLADILDDLEARAAAVSEFIENNLDVADDATAIAANPDLDPLTDDEETQLAELRGLAGQVGSEWRHGETMIPEDDFEDYARELAEDTGMVSDDAEWPLRHINWFAAAAELRADYTTVEFEGTTYLFRA